MMNTITRNNLQKLLINHEWYRRFVYDDATGQPAKGIGTLTAGIGRNLQTNGLTMEESIYLLNNDINTCDKQLTANLPFYLNLDDVRQCALIDLCFNLGIDELMKFEMLDALKENNYQEAVTRLQKTLWGRKAPVERRNDVYQMILYGTWPKSVL